MTVKGFLSREDTQDLLDILTEVGYRCIGPRVREGAIVYDILSAASDLPWGWRDEQGPGRYRLEHGQGRRGFSWANGPQAAKPWLFAPQDTLQISWREQSGKLHFEAPELQVAATAILGMRACDLAALRLHDQHFLQGLAEDRHYAARRADLFLVAVHCTRPAATCFCASTGDGPRAEVGFDLALGETDDGFVVTSGSAAGEGVADKLPLREVSTDEQASLDAAITAAAQTQERRLPSRDLRDALFSRLHHPRWEVVGERCLSCGNCTSVCPTCFCYAESERPALDGMSSRHDREWDSCFTEGHSAIHGVVIRRDTKVRYRQWLTHKLGGWHDQYGRSGCVGCGRCIAWCPVGIDITEEATAICGDEHA